MKNRERFILKNILPVCLMILFFSCANHRPSNKKEGEAVKTNPAATSLTKPAGSYQDTLIISKASAVFYYPDSVQLKKIRLITDSVVYAGTMHEFIFQMQNSHLVIKKNWPALKIIESEKYRYLLFLKKDGSKECVDLNTKNDAYGLFVFDGEKSPVLIDMTNIETDISFYLMK